DTEVRQNRNRQRDLLRAVARLAFRQERQIGSIQRQSGELDEREAAEIIDERAGEQKHQPARIRPAVEHVAHADEHERQEPERQHVVEQENERQKVKDEEVRAEDHGGDYWTGIAWPERD